MQATTAHIHPSHAHPSRAAAWTARAGRDPLREAREARVRLEALARLLDSALRVPGTNIRFGADAMLNLVPGLGTLAAQGLSAYLIWEARRLGAPTGMLVRMAANVGIDFAISAVPVVGWLSDVFYKANLRNMALLRQHLDAVEGLDRRDGPHRHGRRP
ncbi:DUF4112 domain-containing protein [uncultured Alsobacter sp.]|uniref:DUF4112 domain-containing protein n=1 Tax=uncultured Alsobacter sp. TaxID=1748258 RepID=UPI0025D34378|nr:DUF4112 domain-containing protein [uncultured Alsobacter sp.]